MFNLSELATTDTSPRRPVNNAALSIVTVARYWVLEQQGSIRIVNSESSWPGQPVDVVLAVADS